MRRAGGVIWAYMGPPERSRRRRTSNGCTSRRRSASSPSAGRSAIGCRRWRAASTPATCRSCIATICAAIRCMSNTDGAEVHARAPTRRFEMLETEGGLLIGARRKADPGNHYWRITPMADAVVHDDPALRGNALNGHAWVPMDDENCMAWTMTFHPTRALSRRRSRSRCATAAASMPNFIPGTFRPVANQDNDY